MILVVSDLHLTDGFSGTGVEPGAFEVFARLVGDMARHASHRAGGVFRPLEEGLDLILLGDVLDLLRSRAWPPRGSPDERLPRPWDPPQEIAPTVARAVENVLAHNAEGLAMLRGLARDGAVFYEEGGAVRVPVRISYFVGNHDWMLRLRGPSYDAIRARVVEALGLAGDPGRPFPHALEEAERGLAERVRRHRLVLRHGDVFDSFNYAGDRNRSAVGDGVVIELLNRFPDAVREALGLSEEDPLFQALREVDNVRPLATIPAWVLGIIRRFDLEGTPEGRCVVEVWNRLGSRFFALDFVRRRDQPWRWDEVDRLELGFRFVKGFTSGRIVRATVNQLLRLVADQHRRFASHALAEPDVATGAASYVVYGHTHVQEIRPLAIRHPEDEVAVTPAGRRGPAARRQGLGPPVARGAGSADRPPDRQFYFNSGTWRPTYRQTLANPERLEFLGFHALTAVAIYAGDERRGRGFEVWNGALAAPV